VSLPRQQFFTRRYQCGRPGPRPLFRAAISLDVLGNILVDKSQRENQPGKRDTPPFFLPLPPAGPGTA
jgi:hypothetical protein